MSTEGVWIKDKICLNVEVTVTGQRGWVNEDTRELAADLTVEGKVWFSPSQNQGSKLKQLWPILDMIDHPFPLSKPEAIRVITHKPGDPNQPVFPVFTGETTKFRIPEFARHPEAWSVANLHVEIGAIQKTDDDIVDEFNEVVIKALNLAQGNMLLQGNTLSWNVWFKEPELVNYEEWKNHAEVWRDSIKAHHGPPNGLSGTDAKFFDGATFNPLEGKMDDIFEEIMRRIVKLGSKSKIGGIVDKLVNDKSDISDFIGKFL